MINSNLLQDFKTPVRCQINNVGLCYEYKNHVKCKDLGHNTISLYSMGGNRFG